MRTTVKQKLSCFPYLKHNKRRVLAVVISLSVFITMLYVMGYFLGACMEPIAVMMIDPYKKYQIVQPEVESSEYETLEEGIADYTNMMNDKAQEIENAINVDEVIPIRSRFAMCYSVLGMTSIPVFYFNNSEQMDSFSSYMGAELVEGKWPANPGEVVVSMNLYANRGEDVLDRVGGDYEIVGFVESDNYLIYGLPLENENNFSIMILNDEYQRDIKEELENKGIISIVSDFESATSSYNSLMGDSMTTIKTTLTGVAGGLLSLCMLVVLSMHIRDRHDEWCLRSSIGFSTSDVFVMAIKEMLICFLSAVAIGAIISTITVVILNAVMVEPLGLTVNSIRFQDMGIISVAILGIYGLCQIPLILAMRRIQTVDEIE